MKSANNHYAGFGPGTVNNFREIMEMPQISLEERKNVIIPSYTYFGKSTDNKNGDKSWKNKPKQTSISDFMNK